MENDVDCNGISSESLERPSHI